MNWGIFKLGNWIFFSTPLCQTGKHTCTFISFIKNHSGEGLGVMLFVYRFKLDEANGIMTSRKNRQRTKDWNCHTLNAGVRLLKNQFVCLGYLYEWESVNREVQSVMFGSVCLVADDHMIKTWDHGNCGYTAMTGPPPVPFILGQLLGHWAGRSRQHTWHSDENGSWTSCAGTRRCSSEL